MNERNYWLGFSAFPAIGPARFRKLLGEFKTAKDAWRAPRPRLVKLIGEEAMGKFEEFRKEFSIEDYIKKLKEKDVWFLTLEDEDYPKLLKEVKNPPFVLYVRGNPSTLSVRSGSSIAVVGARKTTEYGREVTKLLTTELVLSGFTIVSGLALGVDAISHLTALENGGRTIAVLGCGVDCCYPKENQSIYNSIVQNGCVIVSEFPFGMKPAQWTFPARNRIIAGLSQAVLVTEGAEDSGSLITAKLALSFGRRVFAVPGPITSSMSKGPYKLIAKGAKLVTSADDIFKELKVQSAKFKVTVQSSKFENATEKELKILKLLEKEPLHFDEIVRRTKFNSSKLSGILSLLEIKGLIKSLNGGVFAVVND